jgi:glycerol kinase
MAYQTRDVIEAMTTASGQPLAELRVDGGASAMDVLLQIQADQLGVPVARPVVQETTVAGAGYLAGLAEGVWASADELATVWQLDRRFEPAADRSDADRRHAQWRRAVERSRGWAEPDAAP